ncbi:acyl-CoA dehydrogenase family protein [Mycobacterium lentiflavum]|uniref:Acyl-CoA dehydrogenase family protein n=1 Tax=Mycobacterium lentiflavum TaxID=141349 RepID=A0ABY3V0A4_MYCLN|nr:acyl-CoA dehydrogenase family protein [Mycobacterium lentiflavum]ULP45279.1 acyl-CoA dehydrogenase family protein [Mycobacterium lentiflavum]
MRCFDALCMNEPELAQLRASLRDFLRADCTEFGWRPAVDSWLSCWDPGFSARLGEAGFLGLTIPKRYGGRSLGHLHRYVVIEELLAHGAPIAAHWFADRQLAPALLAYGSEVQRRQLLPLIADGQLYSAIGMSEHAAGSDLAAVQTRATRTDGGWLLRGTKVWTSGAHHAHLIVVLARTSPADPRHRHAGLSQFLVPCDTAGVRIEPVVMMSGEHHFNEVTFDDMVVPDCDVLGTIGEGWRQVTSELAFERSGPERFLSTAPLIFAAVRAIASADGMNERNTLMQVGELLARMISLRQLAVSVARMLSEGADPQARAALVKDLGTRFEQESVDIVAELLNYATLAESLRTMLNTAWLHRPMFSLRGGTNEVLRGVIAHEMALR